MGGDGLGQQAVVGPAVRLGALLAELGAELGRADEIREEDGGGAGLGLARFARHDPTAYLARSLGGKNERMPELDEDSAPPRGNFPSARPADPAEQRGPHRLVQIEMLGARGALQLLPERLRQPHRADDRGPFPSLPGVPAPQQHGTRAELWHLPQGEERGSSTLTRAGKRVSSHRSEALEVDRAVEGISRSRSAPFHAWSPFVR
jgi:hypothetical protein